MVPKSEYSWGKLAKDYWTLLKGRRGRFIYFTSLKSISDLIPFLMVYLLGNIIDFFTDFSSGDSLTNFYFLAGGIAVAGSFQVLLRFYAKFTIQTIAANVRKESRINAIDKIISLDLDWHEKEESGSKIQKINNGGQKLYDGIADFSNDGISIATALIGSLIIFLSLDWKYAVFSFAFLLIYFFGERYFNKKLEYWKDELSKIREKVSGKMQESTSNILAVKSLGLKESINKYSLNQENEFYKIWEKTKRVNQQKSKTIKIFSAISYGLFILLVGWDFVSGAISLGLILVFVNYFDRLRRASDNYTNRIGRFISVKSAVGRFMTILGIDILEKDEHLEEFPKNWKKIEFKNVNFRYKEKLILSDFNLTINRNNKIGIVGKSGCGKSTLAKLLLKLYKPESGQILINGKDLNLFSQKSITKVLGIVMQDSEMFNFSLLENISISESKVTKKKLIDSIEISQLESLIKKLPNGLKSLMGEKGYKLSGGERQRVGIARAIYKNTSLIIFDEATSALDSETEQKIQKGIDTKLNDKTLISIAHRLSTLKKMNRIIVIEKGKIVEDGTFNELIKNKGLFNKLYRIQEKK